MLNRAARGEVLIFDIRRLYVQIPTGWKMHRAYVMNRFVPCGKLRSKQTIADKGRNVKW